MYNEPKDIKEVIKYLYGKDHADYAECVIELIKQNEINRALADVRTQQLQTNPPIQINGNTPSQPYLGDQLR